MTGCEICQLTGRLKKIIFILHRSKTVRLFLEKREQKKFFYFSQFGTNDGGVSFSVFDGGVGRSSQQTPCLNGFNHASHNICYTHHIESFLRFTQKALLGPFVSTLTSMSFNKYFSWNSRV